jgi:hypothetical protein
LSAVAPTEARQDVIDCSTLMVAGLLSARSWREKLIGGLGPGNPG